MKKDIKIEFHVPIYNCNVKVIVTNDFLKSSRKLKDELTLDCNNNLGLAYRHKQDCLTYVILVKHSHKKKFYVLSHEALHVTNFILSDRGVRGGLNNDEAQAYLMSYIIRKIQNKIK